MGALIRFIKGTVAGIAGILPGLSGGVMLVVFGLYDPLIRFIANLREKFFERLRYFLPVILGIGFGILVFSVFVEKALGGRYETVFICLFIGFVLGTVPSLNKTAKLRGRSKKDIVAFFLAGLLLFSLMFFGGTGFVRVAPSIPVWFISGFIIGFGFIIPGLSPSNFLIYFGLYQPMSKGIRSFDFSVVIPLGIGALLCILLFSKLSNYLFDKHYSLMYHIILGLVAASSLAIFPKNVFPSFSAESLSASGWSFTLLLIFCIAALTLGTAASYMFSLFEKKEEKKELYSKNSD